MSDILLSIVIPAYNAEPYLRKCVDSCLNQIGATGNYEIIIVNDGSTDGTQKIIDIYAKEYDKVSFISQPNGGLSKARNEGLKIAKGEYVWFVDSDDWIAENALTVLNKIINDNNHPDVITFRGCDWREGKMNLRSSAFLADANEQSGMDLLRAMGTKYWNPCVPFYCMKRQILIANSLHFMEGVIHEDSEFTPRMLYIAKTAYVSSEVLYYVYQNPVSLNRKKNPEKAFHTLRVIDSLYKFSTTIPNASDRRIFNDIIATTMNTAMKETKDMDEKLTRHFCEQIQRNIVKHMMGSSTLRYKLEGILLLLFPQIFVNIVKSHQ